MAALIRIGISGWRYEPWRKVFYPQGLPQRRELEFASRMFPSIEINGSFYSLQAPQSWMAWRDTTPPGFVFSVKAPRYITHVRRLRDIAAPMANFFASGVLGLNEKLGPFLWQFPPSMRFDPELFGAFLAMLPHDTSAALELAQRREARMRGRESLAVEGRLALRHAVEIRNHSFVDPAFVSMLRQHGVALVVADTAGHWPDHEDVTGDFMYLRLHGAQELYASGYTAAGLDRWAARISAWCAGGQPRDAKLIAARRSAPQAAARDVYCYFDNDIKVKAPFDAARLMQRLGLPAGMRVDE